MAEEDHWLITQGLEHVLEMPGYDQHNILAEIRDARQEFAEQIAQALIDPSVDLDPDSVVYNLDPNLVS